MFKTISTKIHNAQVSLAQRLGAAFVAPTETHGRAVLFVAGLALLAIGLSADVVAQEALDSSINDSKIASAVNVIMLYLEGSFGALIMAAAGVGAIMSAAFGQYKAALSLMVVAVGAFILRSFISTFFNDTNIAS